MIPRDHGFGTSFKGVSAYLMHDKDRANTSGRVAWTHAEGFATQHAETAFRVMAATAMDAKRLKEQAHDTRQAELPEEQRRAFRNSGRSSNAHVWHYSLAWHPDEAAALTKEQMIDAAKASLAQLGKTGQTADQHQALFVCHDDEPHPHVHVVVNRVHPEHGKMLSKFDDWKKFSRWADKYEQERGQVLCHQRRANNMARDMGGHVYGKGHLPHHLATAENSSRSASNDNPTPIEQAQQEQRQKNAELAKRGRGQAQRHFDELRDRREAFFAEKRGIKEQADKAARAEKAKIFTAYQPHQVAMLELHEMRIADFASREKHLFGAARNMIAAVKATWSVQRAADKPAKLSDYYRPFAGEGARLEAFKGQLRQEQRGLEIEREKQLAAAMARVQGDRRGRLEGARRSYSQDRESTKARHMDEGAALKADWRTRQIDQAQALKAAELEKMQAEKQPRQNFNKAAQMETETREETTGRGDDDQKAPAPPPDNAVPEHIRRAKAEFKAAKEQQNQKRGRGKDDPEQER